MTSPFSSRLTKTFIFLLAVGGIVWLGASLTHMIIGYDAFQSGTLLLKDQPEAARLQTIRLYTLLGALADWSFLVCSIGAVGTIVLLGKVFKQYGWLMMCAVLFVLLVPVEAWIAWNNFRLFMLFDAGSGASLAPAAEIVDVFLHRQQNVVLNVCSGLALLSGFTIVTLAVWRPLHKHESR
ncbi:MAG: hypothetical protein SGJ05_01515 [bacterium]|nr:hypothetical protein [bacterium]